MLALPTTALISFNRSHRLDTVRDLKYEGIDVVAAPHCPQFDGRTLAHPDGSQDVVLFNYMLHHAADHTISLLQHARRVTRRYVVIAEDIKAAHSKEVAHAQWVHEWSGTFRGEVECTRLSKARHTGTLDCGLCYCGTCAMAPDPPPELGLRCYCTLTYACGAAHLAAHLVFMILPDEATLSR